MARQARDARVLVEGQGASRFQWTAASSLKPNFVSAASAVPQTRFLHGRPPLRVRSGPNPSLDAASHGTARFIITPPHDVRTL